MVPYWIHKNCATQKMNIFPLLSQVHIHNLGTYPLSLADALFNTVQTKPYICMSCPFNSHQGLLKIALESPQLHGSRSSASIQMIPKNTN